LATIRPASTRVSDAEVMEGTPRDRRGQLGLAGLDSERAPCSQGPLVALRHRLMAQQMDRRLVARTVEGAAGPGAGGAGRGGAPRGWRVVRCGARGGPQRPLMGGATPGARRWA